MRFSGVVFGFLISVSALQGQKLTLKFLDNNWILGGKTQMEIHFIDKRGRDFSSNPDVVGRILNKHKLRISIYHGVYYPNYGFAIKVNEIKPTDAIIISLNYTQGSKEYKKDTTIYLPEIISVIPEYFHADTAIPGEKIVKNLRVIFSNGIEANTTQNIGLPGYFENNSNFRNAMRDGVYPQLNATRFEPVFIWNLFIKSTQKICYSDSLIIRFKYNYVFSGGGANGRNGNNGSSGDNGKTGENAGDGAHGQNGENGTNADDVQVYIQRIQSGSTVSKVKIVDFHTTHLAYVDLANGGTILLNLNGGDGGNGGQGGDGGNGGHSNADEGLRAGQGGNAGYGGDAGNGGNGGTAIIYVDSLNMRYLNQIRISNNAGNPGKQGIKGSAGNGKEGASDGAYGKDGNAGVAGRQGKETVFLKWEP
ncbi:MAG: collagen-like protein [Bacteroidetes bacterium]|nr:collagen-like protein [Bacteroidota bacterium]